jgi:hypothetical protein
MLDGVLDLSGEGQVTVSSEQDNGLLVKEKTGKSVNWLRGY